LWRVARGAWRECVDDWAGVVSWHGAWRRKHTHTRGNTYIPPLSPGCLFLLTLLLLVAGLQDIGAAIAACPSLTELDLSFNHLEDAGVGDIAVLLPVSPRLATLNLSWNRA
jgi:hypothetical protein